MHADSLEKPDMNVGFRSWYQTNYNGQFLVGWVEERNPTKNSRISTQPTMDAKIQLI